MSDDPLCGLAQKENLERAFLQTWAVAGKHLSGYRSTDEGYADAGVCICCLFSFARCSCNKTLLRQDIPLL